MVLSSLRLASFLLKLSTFFLFVSIKAPLSIKALLPIFSIEHSDPDCIVLIRIVKMLVTFYISNFREQEKALKEAAAKASKKGPLVGGGIKKSGKK